MTDIPLPDAIDPDAGHVEFRMYQCRECGKAGPLVQVANPLWWKWGDEHHDTTGHRKIYQYTLTRNTGEVCTIGALRAPKRRALGTRGQ
jgi:hypothetical protein